MSLDLDRRVALVTGGNRGIGRAIAECLATHGARVAIMSRNAEQAATAAEEIGHGTIGLAGDVAIVDDVDRVIGEVEEKLGPVDILVNNAGITRDSLLVRMSEADWGAVLDANLKGAFNTMKRVGRGMMKRRSGRIINVTSVVGLTGNAGQANYAASKAGMVGLTKSVAKELASRNVLVNAVAPGMVDSDMTRALTETQRDAMLDLIPTKRLGTGKDIAHAVLFLSSNLSGYITGQVLVVDGGMVM